MIATTERLASARARRDQAAVEQARRRSDPRERRRWLRFLDLVLPDEIRDAGALTFGELMEMAERPLDGRASRETIWEWWEYARRRSWLEEQESDRWRLTSSGREELHERRRRATQPDPLAGAAAITKWALAVGVVAASSLLAAGYLTTGLAILVVCAAIVLGLLLAALLMRFLDPWLDRTTARRACDWLDGRRVTWLTPRMPAVAGEVRRLYEGAESALSESR